MEDDDDEFSDLYADVLVQASSAISAMHRLNDKVCDNATRGEEEVRDRFDVAEVAGGIQKNCERESECEDVKSENDKYDNRIGNSEFEVTYMSKHGGGRGIEEDGRKRGGIDGNEKSVDGGDRNYQRKILNYDSLSSKSREVDEMARNVDKSLKKGDADTGVSELCFGRDIEGDQCDLEREYGGPKNASESCRPLDLDKCGTVQIFDSVEDNDHEMPDNDSNGMTEVTDTSYEMSRRKRSSISNKVSSAAESESSESSWSRHGQGASCSPSPSVAPSEKYIEKGNRHSEYSSARLARESQEAMNCKRYPSRDFKSRSIKQNTSDERYCERQVDNSRNHSNQRQKSNAMHYMKTRQTNKDAYVIDIKHHYNRHVGHGGQWAMVSSGSYENNGPYYGQPERFLTYSGGFCPDYRLGPNQYWNVHPSSMYGTGLPDGHSMRRMDYEAFEDHNQRRHPVHGNVVGFRKFAPKNSSAAVNQRGTRFIPRVDDIHFRMKTKGTYSPPRHVFDNKFVEGDFGRTCHSGGRDIDHFDRRCNRNLARNRREIESSRIVKRRHDIPLRDNLRYTTSIVNDRNINHRPSPFYSSEETCAPDRGKFLGACGPEPGWVPERKLRCSWKEMHIKSGQYGTNITFSGTRGNIRCHRYKGHHVKKRPYQHPSSTHFMNESIKDDHDTDSFVRTRHCQHSEVVRPRKEDDTMFHSEETSYHFEKNSRSNRAGDRHAFGGGVELIDEQDANRKRSELIREQDGYRKPTQPFQSQMHPRYQYSVDDFVVVSRKCTMLPSKGTSEAGEDECYGTDDLMGRDDNQKSVEDSGEIHPEKAVTSNEGKVDSTLGDKNQLPEFLDIEEGQIITEEIQDLTKRVGPSDDVSQPETASDGNGEVQRLDDEKIREIMVKMERRKERFKEPVTACRDSAKTSDTLPDLDIGSAEAKLERPARKRRWAGI